MCNIGLESLSHLTRLDVSFNKINDSAETVAEILNNFPLLEAFSIKNNKYSNDDSFRLDVLKRLTRASDPEYPFWVIIILIILSSLMISSLLNFVVQNLVIEMILKSKLKNYYFLFQVMLLAEVKSHLKYFSFLFIIIL